MPELRRNRLGEEYNSFARRIMPKDASEVQKIETRRAFYAGAISVFYLIFTGLTPASEPEAADFKMLDDLRAEFEQYKEQLRSGAA